MDHIATLNKSHLKEIFNETAIKKQVTPAIIEKDFWVTWVLGLIPPEYRLKILQDDYKQMRAMIFGGYPDFSEILTKLHQLENQINSL